MKIKQREKQKTKLYPLYKGHILKHMKSLKVNEEEKKRYEYTNQKSRGSYNMRQNIKATTITRVRRV